MTQYMSKSFSVFVGSGKKATISCEKCGKEVTNPTYKVSGRYVCLPCFRGQEDKADAKG